MPGRRKCSTYRFTLCKFRSKRSRCRITNYLGCWRFRFSIWLDEVFKLCSGHLFTPTLRLIGNQQQVYVFNPITARRIYSLFQADKTERAARDLTQPNYPPIPNAIHFSRMRLEVSPKSLQP